MAERRKRSTKKEKPTNEEKVSLGAEEKETLEPNGDFVVIAVDIINTGNLFQEVQYGGDTHILYPMQSLTVRIMEKEFEDFKNFYESKYTGLVVTKRGF